MKSPLPVIAGVAASSQWLPVGAWATMLDYLTERYPGVELETWLSRMADGQVVDETGLRLHERSPYRVGACIFYYRAVELEQSIPFAESVLYQDEHLLVADKPHFLPVIPAGRFLRETLLVRLRNKGAAEGLAPIHRIDRETAGVVVFSLNPATRGLYTSLFRERKVMKTYEAHAHTSSHLKFPLTRRSRIVAGEPFFRMKEIEGPANSETRIEFAGEANGTGIYSLSPMTGKKHQLRLHLAALGISILNDKLYPELRIEDVDDFSQPLKLLAKCISFRDPVTGREHYFESTRKL